MGSIPIGGTMYELRFIKPEFFYIFLRSEIVKKECKNDSTRRIAYLSASVQKNVQ